MEAPFSVPAIDGSAFTKMKWHAGLINGKGRYFDENGQHTGAPLSVFIVNSESNYRFRIIGAGQAFPFRLSVDQHKFRVIASDGFDIEPIDAESVILHNGERYDIELTADQPVDNYWIRAQTLEDGVVHTAYAILRYNVSSAEDPTSFKLSCSASNKCVVVNCPFLVYPGDTNIECKTINEIKRSINERAYTNSGNNPDEQFFNFGMLRSASKVHPSVNGRVNMMPASPPLTQPKELTTSCNNPSYDCGRGKICQCTSAIDIGGDKVY